MNKDTAKKMKTCRTVAPTRNQECNNNAAKPAPPPAKDGQTFKRPKRKASPDKKTPGKRPRNTTETDLHLKVFKRKVRDDGEGPSLENKKRRCDDEETPSSSVDVGGDRGSNLLDESNTSVENVKVKTAKRKANTAAAGEMPHKTRKQDLGADRQEDLKIKEKKKRAFTAPQPQKRQRKRSHTKHQKTKRSEGTSQQAAKQKTKQGSDAQRAEFMAKYQEMDHLGEGGCGSVFAGHRRSDKLPVAIKHIPKSKVYCKHVGSDGQRVSVEVAIMTKLSSDADGSGGSSATVSLLDWYELKQELILVMERPVPCVDLFTHIESSGSIPEYKAQIILKQLVDAAKELEDHEIFHRDIKVDNILIETASDVPRVRLIDFGLGCFDKRGSFYRAFQGDSTHAPPEFLQHSTYRAGPTTVWQLGVVLFDSLHRYKQFETKKFLDNKLKIKKGLSKDCKDFLVTCLTTDPKHRPTLEQLQRHPWLR